jgi:hypothetical protein
MTLQLLGWIAPRVAAYLVESHGVTAAASIIGAGAGVAAGQVIGNHCYFK